MQTPVQNPEEPKQVVLQPIFIPNSWMQAPQLNWDPTGGMNMMYTNYTDLLAMM
jgi:hypothetical protein